jgi:hypothetical protein
LRKIETQELELWTIRVGPDRLAKVTARHVGEVTGRKQLVPAEEAEEVVLASWRRYHREVLGFSPLW